MKDDVMSDLQFSDLEMHARALAVFKLPNGDTVHCIERQNEGTLPTLGLRYFSYNPRFGLKDYDPTVITPKLAALENTAGELGADFLKARAVTPNGRQNFVTTFMVPEGQTAENFPATCEEVLAMLAKFDVNPDGSSRGFVNEALGKMQFKGWGGIEHLTSQYVPNAKHEVIGYEAA
jgi:hypothetical protein